MFKTILRTITTYYLLVISSIILVVKYRRLRRWYESESRMFFSIHLVFDVSFSHYFNYKTFIYIQIYYYLHILNLLIYLYWCIIILWGLGNDLTLIKWRCFQDVRRTSTFFSRLRNGSVQKSVAHLT